MEEEKITFCSFYLGNKLFGVDILDINEINTEMNFTGIDHAPDHIKGYVNIRGNLILITDIAKLLGLQKTEITEKSKLLIVKNHIDEGLGIVVDEIGDTISTLKSKVLDRRKEETDNKSNNGDRRKKSISNGVIKLENELLITIDAKSVKVNLITEGVQYV